MRHRALVIVDPATPPASFQVGGAAVLFDLTDEDLGFAVSARLVRVHDAAAAGTLEEELAARGFDCRRAPPERLKSRRS